jgi:hypothetical protein
MSSLARRSAAAVALVLASASVAGAQTATQTVTFQVTPINVIAFTGSPSLTISTATPGSATATATDATSTWAVTTNQTNAKITASIPTAMPVGLTLSANLVAPTGGTSAGLKALGVVAVDVVTGVTKIAQGSLGVTYQLDAAATSGVVAPSSKVVTYTITGGS